MPRKEQYKYDLSKQRFGRLVAQQRVRKRERSAWVCQCDCGNVITVMERCLLSGDTKSCGCFKRSCQTKNLQGQVFSRLTVLERILNVSPTRWKCRCSCGAIIEVKANVLLCGHTQSCGCLQKENQRKAVATHGLSSTTMYRTLITKRVRDRKKAHKVQWTLEMDIFIKQFFKSCVLCGSTDRLEIDHINPLYLGYELSPTNAVILCKSCNAKKFTKIFTSLPVLHQIMLQTAAHEFSCAWENTQGIINMS